MGIHCNDVGGALDWSFSFSLLLDLVRVGHQLQIGFFSLANRLIKSTESHKIRLTRHKRNFVMGKPAITLEFASWLSMIALVHTPGFLKILFGSPEFITFRFNLPACLSVCLPFFLSIFLSFFLIFSF